MLIKNARLRDTQELQDIHIVDGRFSAIGTHLSVSDEEVIDAKGAMVLPPFVEPHVHLDAALTAGEPRWNMSGTLFEGIQCWSERKPMLTFEDIKSRARRAIEFQIAEGIQFIRTHIDVTDPSLIAVKALVELREELKDTVTLQIVAFPQEGILSFPNGKKLMQQAVDLGCDVVGAIPHFEFTREYGVESINWLVDFAVKNDVLVDVHCDEIDDEQSRFLEVLATRAYEAGIGAKVTASHTTAMHSYNNAYCYKLFRLLKMSGINFVCNPLVSTHLQGRFDTYPKRRGLTRVPDLDEAGINVCFGHDDIVDPWYPIGTGNMLQVLSMGLHACQMLGYEQINSSLDFITYKSARTLNIEEDYGIEVGKPANLLILPAENDYDAVRRQVSLLYSIRQGRVIARGRPREVAVDMGNGFEDVTFKK